MTGNITILEKSLLKVSRSPTPSLLWGKRGKIYSECMGEIVILMLDNLKVGILQFLYIKLNILAKKRSNLSIAL